MNCFFSLIIASKNEEKDIYLSLDSSLKQKYKNYEIIVIDDSTDGTKNIIRDYQKRFDNNYNKLYELLQKEKIKGNIIHNINCITRDHPMPTLEYLSTSNGIVEDMISHDIDIANLYMDFKKRKVQKKNLGDFDFKCTSY